MASIKKEEFDTLELKRQVFENNYTEINSELVKIFGEYNKDFDISFTSKNKFDLISTRFTERSDPEELLLKSSKSEGLFSDVFYETQDGFDFNIGLYPYTTTKFYTVEAKVKDYIYFIDFQSLFKKLLIMESKFDGFINFLIYRWCVKNNVENLEKSMNKYQVIINKKDQRFNEDDKKELWKLVLSFTYIKGLEEEMPKNFWKIKINKITRTVDAGIFSINDNLKIQNVFISKSFRGLGLGKKIFEFGLKERLFTWTSTKNPAVIKILQDLGYRRVGIKYPFDFNKSGNKNINEKYILKNETIFIYVNYDNPKFTPEGLNKLIYNNSTQDDEYTYEIMEEIHGDNFKLDTSGIIERYKDLKLVDLYEFSKALLGKMDTPRYKNVRIILPVSDKWDFCQRKIDVRTGNLVKSPTGVFELDDQWYFYEWDTKYNYLNHDFRSKIRELNVTIVNIDQTIYLQYNKPNFNNFVQKLINNETIKEEKHFEECLLNGLKDINLVNEIKIGEFCINSRIMLGKEAFMHYYNTSTDNEWKMVSIKDKTIQLEHVNLKSLKKDVSTDIIREFYLTAKWNL